MKGKELFLEIGTEEIPAGFIMESLAALESNILNLFTDAHIEFGESKKYGTPRRLAIKISDISEKQLDWPIEKQGPAEKVAKDENGQSTKALLGFAKGQGLPVDDLQLWTTPKGKYYYAVKTEKGVDTKALLPEILSSLVSSIHFKKSMRWKDLDIVFARPIHWIAALFDGEIVNFSFGDIQSSNKSRGHRFHSPEEFELSSFKDYQDKCIKAKVIIDPEERRTIIKEGILKKAKEAGGSLIKDDGLLDEVANLLEYPVVLLGGFDREFLNLPKEVVVGAMREHQRYFSIEDKDGRLLPNFITVSNTDARDMSVVREGNERVLRARLSDAAFYYYEDLNVPLDDMVDSLKNVVFQAKLGTSFEKVERFEALAGYLADELVPELKNKVLRAAHICKADLVSGVVGEFAKLQGVMGRDYAIKAGEDSEVAEAIFEHYLPKNADDILPSTQTGAICSIADKMETICGCFGVGLIPTGASDPYALRRQTIGIINIILDKTYKLSLSELIDKALDSLGEKLIKDQSETKEAIVEFFRLRLLGLLTSKGNPADVVDAVLSRGFNDILDTVEVVKALSHLKGQPDFEPLAVTFKRVVNITKDFESVGVDPSIFEKDAEKDLHSSCHAISGDVMDLAGKGKYKDALLKASTIRPLVDRFFDDIMVMVENEKLKTNRLSLLKEVSQLFTRFADFSKIVTEKK